MSYVPTAAEQAIHERDLMFRQYRKKKREEYANLFAIPVYGEFLRKFHATLGHFNLSDPPRMIAYVKKEAAAWLRHAPAHIRQAALEMINNRIVRLRVRAGKEPFDDPLPGQPDNPFLVCKRELGL